MARSLLVKKFLLFLVLAALLAGCGEPIDDQEYIADLENNRPEVVLSSSAPMVVAGDSVELQWSSIGMNRCFGTGDWSGDKPLSGSETVNPINGNRSFNLTCTGDDGNQRSSTVTVALATVSTLSLSASPDTLTYGGSTMLTWSASGVTTCTASGAWLGSKAVSGTHTISGLTATSSFDLSCSGPGGDVSDTVVVNVTGPMAPSVNLSASPSTIAYNAATTLSWDTDNVTSCIASGDWSGGKATSGAQTIGGLTTDANFVLTCTGPAGAANDTVSVSVGPVPPPVVSLSASPATVAINGSTTLSWNVTDATNCTASGAWSGNKTTSGSETINGLSIDANFVLSCSGSGGNESDSVAVSVVTANNGTALLSWMPPTQNIDGTAADDLAGYRIYYGTSSGNYTHSITLNNPGLTSYLVENLGPAVWYFAVTAFKSTGVESAYSEELSGTIN